MAVDAIKESSDLCLPLKGVVGAMSVLMKNFNVSNHCSRIKQLLILCLLQQKADNVGSVKEIQQRVRVLSGILASPVSEDDHAEK